MPRKVTGNSRASSEKYELDERALSRRIEEKNDGAKLRFGVR